MHVVQSSDTHPDTRDRPLGGAHLDGIDDRGAKTELMHL
jgi:hypothetical protein